VLAAGEAESFLLLADQADQSDQPCLSGRRSRPEGQQAAAAGEQRDLRVQRAAPGPVVELIQPGAQQKDQMAEQIARKQEGGPGLRAVELGIAIPQHDRTHLAHKQPF
jgi:hypothetical protein